MFAPLSTRDDGVGPMYNSLLLAAAGVLSVPASATGTALATATQHPVPGAISAPQQRAQALQDIQEMKARIGRIESALGVPSTPIQYTPDATPLPKDHNLELYGFVQTDAIQDFDRVHPDWDATLRPSRIPTIDG